MKSNSYISNLKHDLPASLVVFFVALPLCLGIALASGAPLLSGIISGIVGGIVAGILSGSSLGVSGPAAGLAVIVYTAISDLKIGVDPFSGFSAFLVAGAIAGVLQILFGVLRGGKVALIFPSSVIKGMLVGIGVIIFLKQLPHLVGYDAVTEGDFAFNQNDGESTLSEFIHIMSISFNKGAVVISAVSLFILIFWQAKFIQRNKVLSLVPGPLLAVVAGIVLAKVFASIESLTIPVGEKHFVNIPQINGLDQLTPENGFYFPDWSFLSNPQIWIIGVTIALVASIETLLCVEATDNLDPYHKKVTPKDRELVAQGASNLIAALIGGIPVTQVIVRSSANIQAGGRTKVSAIFHGVLLIVAVFVIPKIINMIPIATLAAVLTIVGYKLANPKVFVDMFKNKMIQFLPFISTVIFMLFTDLLTGVTIGFVVALLFVIYLNLKNGNFKIDNFKKSIFLNTEDVSGVETSFISFKNNVTFLSKPRLIKLLNNVSNNSSVKIDISQAVVIHPDITKLIEDFEIQAVHKRIKYKLIK
jgi:MFS superfamily sulfate permease-like transporter